MSESHTESSPSSERARAVVVGSGLPSNAADILQGGDSHAQCALAKRYPEVFVRVFQRETDVPEWPIALDLDDSERVAAACVPLDACDFNATELFGWFTRHERYLLALRLVELWRDRDLDLPDSATLESLAVCAQFDALDGVQWLSTLPAAAAALAMGTGANQAERTTSPLWVRASELTGFPVLELESQVSTLLDELASAPDALGYGALTLARHPAVGEPGVTCNRTLINVLCSDCRARAHHNALDTLRNRLQSGQLRATEMLEHLLAAIKHCGGIRRVHLLEADLAAGVFRSRKRLHVRGAVPLQPLEVAIGAAPALESFLLAPQTRLISPDAVHPDVAALAESPLLPGKHSIIGSLLVGDCPQALVVADAEGLPISVADAARVHDLVQLGSKLLSLLAGNGDTWRKARRDPTSAVASATG
ncbi:MAG: hypothetical protein AAF499_02150 [Pseudomonadota bacterium]